MTKEPFRATCLITRTNKGFSIWIPEDQLTAASAMPQKEANNVLETKK